MPARQPLLSSASLPLIWIVSDARNDAVLEQTLARLPRGSGLIFRHYHLGPEARAKRFAELARVARRFGHCVVLSGTAREARRWGTDAAYGAPASGRSLATVHSLRELATAHRTGARAVLLSPVFPTRSHPGGKVLGTLRFRLIAMRARVPVIALGGMTERHARHLGAARWAAIDGLS